MSADRVAYLTCDAGIPPDSSKGASVHFRELAAAFARIGVPPDAFLARSGDVSGFHPHRARTVPTPRGAGVAGEVVQAAHAGAMLAALQAAGPHAAVYERLSLFGLAGLAHARALGVPHVVEVNAPLWREAAEFRGLALRETGRGACLDVLRAADRVLAVSGALADELADAGIPRANIEIFGNGADVARFGAAVPAEKPAVLRGKPTLLFVGSLKPWHGIEFLLDAFAALRKETPCGLWIVGDGPGRGAVEAAARANPADIIHHGAVEHDEVPSILQAADLVCAPYSAAAPAYFSPLKVVEAIAARRPLLVSRVPCVLETLQGFTPPGLFTPDDRDDFVRAARRALASGTAIPERLVAGLDWATKASRIAHWLGLTPAGATMEEVPVHAGG